VGEAVNRVGQVIGISKPRGNLYVEANQPEAGPTGTSRIFHPVPGLQALPLMWSLPPTEALEIQISILHTR